LPSRAQLRPDVAIEEPKRGKHNGTLRLSIRRLTSLRLLSARYAALLDVRLKVEVEEQHEKDYALHEEHQRRQPWPVAVLYEQHVDGLPDEEKELRTSSTAL
jgi:hypothetical protein